MPELKPNTFAISAGCTTCKIVWHWPKAYSTFTKDMKRDPRCPMCNEFLVRTKNSAHQYIGNKNTTREEIGLK